MNLDSLTHTSGEWLRGTGPESDIVISSRIRLARNLAAFPFTNRATHRLTLLVDDVSAKDRKLTAGTRFTGVVRRLDWLGRFDVAESPTPGSPALLIERDRGDAVRPAGGQHGVAAEVRGLSADLAHAPVDDVVDHVWLEAVAVLECIQQQGRCFYGMVLGECAAAPPEGRANGVDDDDITHW